MNSIRDVILMIADEIEYKPGEDRPFLGDLDEERKIASPRSSELSLPGAQEENKAEAVNETDMNQLAAAHQLIEHLDEQQQDKPPGKCMLKSKGGNLKPFLLHIKNKRVLIKNNSKTLNFRPNLDYPVDLIQSIVAKFTANRRQVGRVSETYLILVFRDTTRRSIFFESSKAA